METPFKPVLSYANRISIRLLLCCFLISGTGIKSFASPDDLIQRSKAHLLTSWNLYGTTSLEDDSEINVEVAPVALSCIPEINISLGLGGFAVLDALTLVNAPDYPAFQYEVDIMGPLNDTVFCAQLGQEVMVVVTEIPTGNSCMSTVFVEDKLRPTLVCLSDTLPCNIDIQSINFEDYIETATDNCDDDPTLWYSYVIQNLPCNPHHFTQQILVTWTATDDSGNSATCQDIIYLKKPALGQIVFPPNISISCVNANTDPSNTGEPTFNGEPIGLTCQLIVFHTDQVIPMCNGAMKILRTWTVRDWCTSGMVTRVQEILVVDNTPPVLTCPANLTINAGPGVCTTKYTLPLPVVTDLCATPNQIDIDFFVYGIPGIYSPGQMVTLGLGTTTITIRATDPCGNSSTCNYVVTVRDNTPPVLICPPSVTVGCSASTAPSNTGTATAYDICDSSPDITYSDITVATTDCALGYIITRTWTATDNSGNSISCMQMITLTDNTPPVITCPVNVTISCTASTAPAATGTATASDDCDDVPAITFSDVTAAGGCPQDRIINRTWRATDDCGNSSTCLQQIFIEDNVPPVITCPPDVTINCEDSTAPSNTGLATASDNCDPNPILTFSDVNVPAGPHTYTINRTWTATDHCGNSSTCLQEILVHDNEPPTITCPSNITIACTASTLPANTGTATATDNCDPIPVITYVDVTTAGACPQEGTITRTWTATDACGNTSTCVQTIVIDDSVAPLITCPINITIECTENTLPVNTGSATATDLCDLSPTITFTDAIAGGSCPQESTISRTWIATDDCGNSSTCLQTIVVNDSAPPVITCPINITILCTESTAPSNTGTATASDLCDISPAVTFTDVTVAGICTQEYTINRTWQATDDCGNSSTCLQTIFINDNAAPLITCPSNITIECSASTLPANTGTATATDNCTGTPTIAFSDVTAGGACPQELTITRTWTASDGCGNSTSCIQIIVVDDSVAPVITCPANVTISCTDNTAPASTGLATAVDNCDTSPSIAFSDLTVAGGTCAQEYTINRTWIATDDCGNASTCLQVIFIDDSTPPVITCPVSVTIECSESTLPANTGTATATDNCDGTPLISFSDISVPGPCPQEFSISRTWTASDDCGNSSTCVQAIIIIDSTPPSITCPINVTIECTESTAPSNTGVAIASDVCDTTPGVTFSDITLAAGCENEYSITRTWTATDDCGNTSTCNQIISVQDNTPPTITCPDDVTISCSDNTDPGVTGSATATDNCDDTPAIDFTDVTGGGSCEDGIIITRTWTATDGCGNTSTCIQIILAIDNTAPTITCPSSLTIECDESTDPDNTGIATGIDLCDSSPLIDFSDVTAAGNDCPEEYTITRTWIATDECGNSSTCTQIISIDDSTAPLVTCPDDVTLECGDDTLPGSTGTATASDNCDTAPSVDFDDVTFGNGCPDGYTITRTWIATDNCGNTGVCTQTIVIDDNQAPLVFCPANTTIDCEASTAPGNTGTATASDACDENPDVTFTDAIVAGACPQEFTIVRTWMATDNCGNTGTCNQMIGVEDTTAPACVAVNITVSLDGSGNVTILASQVGSGSSDNCGTTTLAVAPNTFDCEDIGENLVVLTVTDCPGNSSTCTATVTVEDNSSLQANCQDLVIFLDANGNASVDPADVDNGSGGGCSGGDLEFDLSQTEFNCTDLGTNVVILTVTDEEGNTATCTAIITVTELFPPEITCPANLTVDCHEVTDPDNTGQFGNATATDNCPGVFITETHVINLSE
ncbi:MAG TPA: HYR domain-containing protein, partial [Saprospiraceae bacterium]